MGLSQYNESTSTFAKTPIMSFEKIENECYNPKTN